MQTSCVVRHFICFFHIISLFSGILMLMMWYFYAIYFSWTSRCISKGTTLNNESFIFELNIKKWIWRTRIILFVLRDMLAWEMGENGFVNNPLNYFIWPRGHQSWDFLKSEISQKIWVLLTKLCHQMNVFSNSNSSASFFSNLRFFSNVRATNIFSASPEE